MLTKEQLRIFAVFKQDIFAELTFKQIKTASRQNSNSIIQLALTKFKEENLIKTKNAGNVHTYSLNLENNLAIAYLNLVNENEVCKNKLPKKILKEIQQKVSKYTEFFVFLVFGSYVKGKFTQKSDLDIAIIVESEQTKKEIMPILETIKRRELTKIDYHVFTRKEFIEMLETDYENVGKQIYKNHIVYYGFTEYTNLILKTK